MYEDNATFRQNECGLTKGAHKTVKGQQHAIRLISVSFKVFFISANLLAATLLGTSEFSEEVLRTVKLYDIV